MGTAYRGGTPQPNQVYPTQGRPNPLPNDPGFANGGPIRQQPQQGLGGGNMTGAGGFTGNDPTFGGQSGMGGPGYAQRQQDSPQVNMPSAVGSAGAASMPFNAPMGVPAPRGLGGGITNMIRGGTWGQQPTGPTVGGGTGSIPGTPGWYGQQFNQAMQQYQSQHGGGTPNGTNNPWIGFGGTPGTQGSSFLGQPYQKAGQGQFQYGQFPQGLGSRFGF